VAVDAGWWRLLAGIGRRGGTEGERTGGRWWSGSRGLFNLWEQLQQRAACGQRGVNCHCAMQVQWQIALFLDWELCKKNILMNRT
jgi:hypothetical protein